MEGGLLLHACLAVGSTSHNILYCCVYSLEMCYVATGFKDRQLSLDMRACNLT